MKRSKAVEQVRPMVFPHRIEKAHAVGLRVYDTMRGMRLQDGDILCTRDGRFAVRVVDVRTLCAAVVNLKAAIEQLDL